jgi:dynein heavy chain, axonemal
MQLLDMMRPEGAKRGVETASQLWALFVEQCHEKLHIVLCMSPIEAAFRERLRANPCIVSCCTIDWFHPWPKDALEAVAAKFLTDLPLEVSPRLLLASLELSGMAGPPMALFVGWHSQ